MVGLEEKGVVMKVLRIEAMKFHAGSWNEVGPVLKELKSQGKAAGFPRVKMYASISGGDVMHTIYMISEWESLAAMESLESKAVGKKKVMDAIEKLSEIVDSSEVVLLKELTNKDLGI
jgi:hypothetical protein